MGMPAMCLEANGGPCYCLPTVEEVLGAAAAGHEPHFGCGSREPGVLGALELVLSQAFDEAKCRDDQDAADIIKDARVLV